MSEPKVGIEVLTEINNDKAVSPWLKNINTIIIIAIMVTLLLGVNAGKLLESYVQNRITTQNTQITQKNTIENASLNALIELNSEMSLHISELTQNINILIEENQRLTKSNEDLNKTLLEINQAVFKLQEENKQLQKQIEDLQKQIEALK